MNDLKNWLTSKTVWAAAIGVVLQVLHGLNIHIGFLDTVDADVFAGHLADVASAVFFLAAGLFRVTATKKLTA